jgi:hypothetical protein
MDKLTITIKNLKITAEGQVAKLCAAAVDQILAGFTARHDTVSPEAPPGSRKSPGRSLIR